MTFTNILLGTRVKVITKSLKNPKSGWQTATLVAVVSLAYLYRASQYLFKPQLFGEDGGIWLTDGYNHGIDLLFKPVAGFLHVPERLFGFIVAHSSLHFAPLIFNLTAWLIFILLTYYLFSNRTRILTNNFERLFMVAALCLMANLDEFFFNFSNSIFLLGIIGVLIMVARKPKSKIIALIEKIIFTLSCFTLPFAWFYLPITLIERLKYHRRNLFFLFMSLVGSIVQLTVYLSSHANRSTVTIQSVFSKHSALEIYNQIVTPAIRFARIDTPTFGSNGSHDTYTLCVLVLSMTVLLLATFTVLKRSNKHVWYLLFFLGAMTFASLKSPQLRGDPTKVIQFLSVATGGDRYFVYGILAVNIIFIKTIYTALVTRARYAFMGVFMGFGLISSLHYNSFYIEKNFVDYRAQYYHGVGSLESGAVKDVRIQINPNDALGWWVTLKAK